MKKILFCTCIIVFQFSAISSSCAQKLIRATVITRQRDTIRCFIRKPSKKVKFLNKVVTYNKQGDTTTYTPNNSYGFIVRNNYYMHASRPDGQGRCFLNVGPPFQQVIKQRLGGLELYVLRLNWPSEKDTPEESDFFERNHNLSDRINFLSSFDTAKSYVINDSKKLKSFTQGFTGVPTHEVLFCGYHLRIYVVLDGKILDAISVNTDCNFATGTTGTYYFNSLPFNSIKTSQHASFADVIYDRPADSFLSDLHTVKDLISTGKEPSGVETYFSKSTAQFNAVLKKYLNKKIEISKPR